MRAPQFPHRVTVRTPLPPTTDPRTGNELPGEYVETETRAYLAQNPVSVLRTAVEFRAGQSTVIANGTLLVPPGVNLQADSEVVDEDEGVWRVSGSVAPRRGLGRRVIFLAASVQRISDLGVSGG